MYNTILLISFVVFIFCTYILTKNNPRIILISLLIHLLLVINYIISFSHGGIDSPSTPYNSLEEIYSQISFYSEIILSVLNLFLFLKFISTWNSENTDLVFLTSKILFIVLLTYVSLTYSNIFIFWFLLFPFTLIFGIVAFILNYRSYKKQKKIENNL